jgi:TusE/DsrC/DsvC family sulfur relay protein
MSDINKYIGREGETDLDKLDRMDGLDPWDEARATELAQGEGLSLSDAHLQVLTFLRDTYIEHGFPAHARDLSEMLDSAFRSTGGIKYLYELFPAGPVNQGCRLAGLPAPAGATDASFGSSF